MHYPAIAEIVKDECEKRGILYNSYATLPEITARFQRYMREAGRTDVGGKAPLCSMCEAGEPMDHTA
eukprot:1160679-Pelagomonas_calceolata.AAC.25